MAIIRNQKSEQEFVKADAWLNLSITDKDGVSHRLGKIGVGLYMDRAADAALIKKMAKDPDFLGKITVSYQLVGEKADIEL